MTIDVQLTRSIDGPGVLATLAANGIDGKLAKDGLELAVRADDAATVGRLLDTWVGERGLPFVPVQVARSRYALRPPAG